MQDDSQSEFRTVFSGRLSGLLKWEVADALFARVADEGEAWFVYDVSAGLPEASLSGEALTARLTEIRDWAFKQNRGDPWCGCMFVNDRDMPRMIKVYDPGSGSFCSVTTPLPAYVISRMPPEKLPFDAPEIMFDDGSGRSILDRLLGRKRNADN